MTPKICHISSMHADDDDRIFERACVSLARAGYKTYYIVTSDQHGDVNGVEIIPLKKRSGLRKRIFSSFEAYRIARKLDADIYHFHDPDLIPWMYLLTLENKKVIYDIHENYLSRFWSSSYPTFLKKTGSSLYRFFERFAIKHFGAIITTTQTMADLYTGVAKRYCVVSNTVDIKRLEGINLNTEKYEHVTIYTSGTHRPDRNCSETVEGFALVHQEFPDARLMFVGRYLPGYDVELKELAQHLGIGDKVEVTGMLPWAVNFERTAKTHIGCVFYEDNLNNRVTTPNRLYEYMFCGVAVIARDFTELNRVVTETQCGILVDSSDPKSVAEGFRYMLSDPGRTAQMGKNGQKAVFEKYNFSSDFTRMLHLYEQVYTS